METKKNRKTIKKGGRKSSLLIVRKKNKKGRFYHVNTATGKQASSDEYRLQWVGGKRVKNKVVTDTINISNQYIEEGEKIDWNVLRNVQKDVLKTETAIKLRKLDLDFRKDADTMVYYEARNLLKTTLEGSPDTKIKILKPDGQRYGYYSPAQAIEIMDNFIHKMNSKIRDLQKTKIKLSPLPQISFIHNSTDNVIQFDLKNLIGEENRQEILDILQSEISK